MLPATMRAPGSRTAFLPGDFVRILTCSCRVPHGRYGIIDSARPSDGAFLVLLADSLLMAQHCLAGSLEPATAEEIVQAVPRAKERMEGMKREARQLLTLRDAPPLFADLMLARR